MDCVYILYMHEVCILHRIPAHGQSKHWVKQTMKQTPTSQQKRCKINGKNERGTKEENTNMALLAEFEFELEF